MSKDLSTPEQLHLEIAKRTKEVIRFLDMSKNEFALAIGHRNLTKSLHADKAASIKIIIAIHQHYPDISMEWLLTGRGSMHYYNQESQAAAYQDAETGYQNQAIHSLIRSLDSLTEVVKTKLDTEQ
jgi:hypothetical protein